MATVTIEQAASAKRSITCRKSTLRRIKRSRWVDGSKSPINDVEGAFDHEIQVLEDTYNHMLSRLEQATVNIPD